MRLPLTAEAARPRQRPITHPAYRAGAAPCAIVVVPTTAAATPAASTATSSPTAALPTAPPASAASPSSAAASSLRPAHHGARAVEREHGLRIHPRHPPRQRRQRRPRRLHVHERAATRTLAPVLSPAACPAALPLRWLAALDLHALAQRQPCPRSHLDRGPALRRLLRRQPLARAAPYDVARLVHLQPFARLVGAHPPAHPPAVLAHVAPLQPALLAPEARDAALHVEHHVRPSRDLRAVRQPHVALAHGHTRRRALVARCLPQPTRPLVAARPSYHPPLLPRRLLRIPLVLEVRAQPPLLLLQPAQLAPTPQRLPGLAVVLPASPHARRPLRLARGRARPQRLHRLLPLRRRGRTAA